MVDAANQERLERLAGSMAMDLLRDQQSVMQSASTIDDVHMRLAGPLAQARAQYQQMTGDSPQRFDAAFDRYAAPLIGKASTGINRHGLVYNKAQERVWIGVAAVVVVLMVLVAVFVQLRNRREGRLPPSSGSTDGRHRAPDP